MTCPFLSETRVRYCHASTTRKMLAAGQGDLSAERCSNSNHLTCQLYETRPVEDSSPTGACPHFHETLAHYCGAAPIPRFIPFSDQAGRCGGSGYRFCDLYLQFERAGDNASGPHAGQMRVPSDFYYTANHLWLHIGPNGTCHIGIDQFFASLLHSIDNITFVTTSGVDRPSVVLNVQGVDWQVSFPNRMLITGAHVYLRGDPSRLAGDPYGTGWLFEGCEIPGHPVNDGLMQGRQALAWMALEQRKLDEAVHEMTDSRIPAGMAVMNDGGTPVSDILGQLEREEILRMLHTFFAPDRTWGEESQR